MHALLTRKSVHETPNPIAYDIAQSPRRQKIARVCADFGTRVQENFLESHRNEKPFERFWQRLREGIDPGEDRFMAHPLDAKNARAPDRPAPEFAPGAWWGTPSAGGGTRIGPGREVKTRNPPGVPT